ncbi:MAG: glycoside hydrolase family 97 catalytic domain-containing protein [Chitinophagaceae bacterium]|nr:glycoside hydrolase family 97 catalytic domain-containing protein [Chitinophagaceae bacterium]
MIFVGKRIFLITAIGAACSASIESNAQLSRSVIIKSPDATIGLSIMNENGKVVYLVEYNRRVVIEPSSLSLLVDGKLVGEKVMISKVRRSSKAEMYAYRGIHSRASDKYAEAIIDFTGGSPFTLQARVFNDGIAFRYIITGRDSAVVEKDYTKFRIPKGSSMWAQSNIKYYEGRYSRKLIDTVRIGELIGPPVTFELAGNVGYAALTEGGVTDFAGMSFIVMAERTLQANLSGVARKKGTIETPWRIITVGKDLNALVNSDIISNVSPKYDATLFPKGYQTDWIKPGRSVWSWLAKTRRVTLENMKHFSDLAAELGFEYNLVDEGWSNWKDSMSNRDHWDMLKELVEYSAPKGVKIWLWKAYPDRKGIPGIKSPEQRKAFFKKCSELGIAGLKIDFFDNEAQEIIQFYQAALKDAALYKLMINFHGANKPTGEARTWPNEMTREAIRGMENQPPWATSNTILPFTRYLAGHADFTPVHFGDRMGEVSWAHHVASLIVFNSPFLCLGADPQSILDNPCKEMIQSIPPVWDETIVLPQSKIGELVLYARRNGTTWFLAAMSSKQAPQSIEVDLSFLKFNYTLSSVKDDKDKKDNALFENVKVAATSKITIELNKNGGFAGRFERIK